MKLFFLLIFIVISTNSSAYNVQPVIQRFAVIGTSLDGKKLALMLTHFGPTSGAPFANLVIFEAGTERAIFKANAFAMQGDETTLASIARELLERNKSQLQKWNIDYKNPKYSNANYALMSDISGTVDIENVGQKLFLIKNDQSSSCAMGETQTVIKLDGQKLSLAPLNAGDCMQGPIQLRTIFRTSTSLWFIVLRKANFLDIPFYLVEVGGLCWQ